MVFICLYCGADLGDVPKTKIFECPTCRAIIPKCGICEYYIFGNEAHYETEPCNHLFHKECIYEWLGKDETCPICKEPIKKLDFDISDKL